MSWVCENCSTCNTDNSKVCFVCEIKRSNESIRRARRLAKKAFIERIKLPLCDNLTKGGMVVFFVSIICFSIVGLISLYLTMSRGLLNDIVLRCIAILKIWFGNIVSVAQFNCVALIDRIISSPVSYIPGNAEELCIHIYTGVLEKGVFLVENILLDNLSKLERLIEICICIKDAIFDSLKTVFKVFDSLGYKLTVLISNAFSNIVFLIGKIREQILQFI